MDVTFKAHKTDYPGPSEISSSSSAANPDQQDQPNSSQTHVESNVSLAHDAVLIFAKEAVASRDLTQDLAISLNWNGGQGLFSGWREKVSGALNAAYPTFLHLVGGGEAAVEKAINHPYFEDRKRKLKKANPALIALYLTAKPDDAAQRSACSEYAVMLIWAAQNKVGPFAFVERMEDVTLKRCKMEVRAARRINQQAEAPGSTASGSTETDHTVTREASATIPTFNAAASEADAVSGAEAAEIVCANPTPAPGSTPAAEMLKEVEDQPRVERKLTLTIVNNKGTTREFACSLEGDEVKALFKALDRQTSSQSALSLLKQLVASLENPEHPTNKEAARA